MQNKTIVPIILLLPFLLFGQMINNFDSAPADSTYWVWEMSENADPDSGYINMSYVDDPVSEGAGAMQLEYSAHNIEAWGGYSKILHMSSAESDPGDSEDTGIVFSGAFGGAIVDGNTYTNPSGAEAWAGFANEDTTIYPFSFPGGGTISFTGATGGADVDVYFRFEYNPYPDTEPSYNTATVHINGTSQTSYSVEIPAQADTNTYSSFLLYVVTQDAPVTLTNVAVTSGIVFSGAFGGALVDSNTYTFPTGAEGWAGFANNDTSIYPFSFPNDGSITFIGATAGSVDSVDVYFRFEYNPYPDVDPSYNTATVTVVGSEASSYSVEIPAQGPSNTYSSFLFYVQTPDAPVTITNVNVLNNVAVTSGIVFSGAFGGTNVTGNTYTFPTGAEGWGGFANEDTSIYPFSFPNGGTISFTGATAGTDADVYFKFEYNPYPDVDPSYNTAAVTVSGTAEASYSVDIPAQGANTYSSFLLYVQTLDAPVTLTDVTVTEETGSALAQANDWDATFDDGTALFSMLPDGEVWDWSQYDSISFSYYNSVSQSLEGRVHLRLNLSDFGDIADPASYTGLGEYYYSFHYILDNDPGWNTINIPLERTDDWAGAGFNLTGWAGEAGNGELDTDAIAAFHLEFSISGGGDGDRSYGTIILDNFTLTGSKNVLSNPGFELADATGDGSGWGAAIGGGHAEVVTDASVAYNGDNYLSIGTTDNWAVYYTEDNIPAQYGETWEFSGYGMDIGGDGSGAAFKLDAKDADGNVIGSTNDVVLAMTNDWENHSIEYVAPVGTVTITAVVVASRWDGVACDFAFDDMFLMNVGILDVVPPAAVENVAATPYSYYNLVTWSDNDGEEGETYNVYGSLSEITDITAAGVDVIATGVLEGSQAAVHYIYAPLEDESQAWYYAVSCSDASLNVGEAGIAASAITNTAKGIPTVSLDPPSTFAADGDLSEWYDSGIVPFTLATTDNSWGTPHIIGAVTDDNDLSGTIFLAVDDDYLYVAAEVTDDVYDGYQPGDGTGGWWENDVLELFIGLYEQPGTKHVGMMRGDEPDYKFYFLETHAVNDFNSQDTLAVNGTENYYHEGIDPDWVLEAKLALDDIAFGDDIRLNAVDGMRIPIEPTFHDNDGAGWEGNLVASPINMDNAYQTPSVWSSTWIGGGEVGIDNEIIPLVFALHPNYPNPFNPITNIQFTIPEQADVKLRIYNVLGRQVDVLVNETLPVGHHKILWNPKNLSSGVYFYKLEAGSFIKTRKMILLK